MSIENNLSIVRDYVENSYGDEDGRRKSLEAIDRLVIVIKEAISNEREACAIVGAKTMEDMGRKAGGKMFADGQVIADAIRARSNNSV